jgi:hypothetical protein
MADRSEKFYARSTPAWDFREVVAKGPFPDDFSTDDLFRYTLPSFSRFLHDEVIIMGSKRE